MKKLIRNLINIGNRKDYAGSLQRSILMANLCALGGIVSLIGYSLVYFYLDPIGLQPVIWINLLFALLLSAVFMLNDKKHYGLTAVWLILCLSVPVFITLRLYLGYRSGIHAFFILFSILPILIIPVRRRVLIFLLSAMVLSFYFLTYHYIPADNLVFSLAKGVLSTLETINMLFVLVVILIVFYSNQQIIDSFENDLSDKHNSLETMLATVRKSATVDALTDIVNRGHMEVRISEELARGYRYGFPISLMMFDIDHFKKVNDAFGHDAGDQVLKMIASIVKSSIRETDTLGRWGGEEFMILLPYTHEVVADKVARKLCHIIAESQHGDYGNITASFGVAQWDGVESFERLYKRLDNALYAAKEQGRNQVVTDLLHHIDKQTVEIPAWIPEWESSNPELNRQHRQIIVNLASFLRDEERSIGSGSLDLLILDLASHFEYEENLLLKIGYPEAESHKLLHRKLLRWIKTMRNEHASQSEYPQHSIHILQETVINHMLEEDFKFFPFLR